jgi:tRNA (cytosine34-C5)-methyltransferase
MGWKKGKKGQSKQNKKTDGKANNPDNSGWKNDTRREIIIVKENERFEEFYRTQDCFDNSEMEDFMAALRRPLPQTWRFAGFRGASCVLLERLKDNYLKYFKDLEIDGEKITPPAPMSWYPDNLAWHTNLSRTQLRRHPNLTEMHRFLIAETESGYVTRQEAVSMIPPLFMDIKSSHAVLDLCAAPGSKTAQIMEIMHNEDTDEHNIPDGLCIANDRDNKRCYMLVHQAKRLNSPACIITNHDATMFPGVVKKNDAGEFEALEFDRILADVPCTGDGTMRKNYDIWKKWTPENSLSVHATQIKILKRALELLKIGGKVVYSTCSMSPLEDEAVVGHVLSQVGASAELVDCSAQLPDLKRRKGVSSWKVQLKDFSWYEKFADIPKNKSHVMSSVFPPENAEDLNLDRCMRFLPHDQDTGGFFVCVIEKKARLPWESEKNLSVRKANYNEKSLETRKADQAEAEKAEAEKVHQQQLAEENREEPQQKKPKIEKAHEGTFKEDAFWFFEDKEHEVVKQLTDFYHLNETNYPTELVMSRSDPNAVKGGPRQLYMVSKMVKEVLKYNNQRLKFINAGVRCFSRTEIKHCDHPYRLAQDGIDILSRYIPKTSERYLVVTQEDMVQLLQHEYPKYDLLSESLQKRNTELTQVVGCVLLRMEPNLKVNGVECPMIVTGWRGAQTLRCYVNKFDRRHFLHLLDASVPEAIDLKASKIRSKGTEVNAAQDRKVDVNGVVSGEVSGKEEKVEIPDNEIETE